MYYKIEKLDRVNKKMLIKVCTKEELEELKLTFEPQRIQRISKMDYKVYKRKEKDGYVEEDKKRDFPLY